MVVKAVIHEKYRDMEVHVCSSRLDREVSDMVTSLAAFVNDSFRAKDSNGELQVIPARDILSVFAENQKVKIRTAEGCYESPLKLYEFETLLSPAQFLRISRGEFINIKKIQRLDLGITGTIRVILSDGSESYTSRRNVTRLKQALGI